MVSEWLVKVLKNNKNLRVSLKIINLKALLYVKKKVLQKNVIIMLTILLQNMLQLTLSIFQWNQQQHEELHSGFFWEAFSKAFFWNHFYTCSLPPLKIHQQYLSYEQHFKV